MHVNVDHIPDIADRSGIFDNAHSITNAELGSFLFHPELESRFIFFVAHHNKERAWLSGQNCPGCFQQNQVTFKLSERAHLSNHVKVSIVWKSQVATNFITTSCGFRCSNTVRDDGNFRTPQISRFVNLTRSELRIRNDEIGACKDQLLGGNPKSWCEERMRMVERGGAPPAGDHAGKIAHQSR